MRLSWLRLVAHGDPLNFLRQGSRVVCGLREDHKEFWVVRTAAVSQVVEAAQCAPAWRFVWSRFLLPNPLLVRQRRNTKGIRPSRASRLRKWTTADLRTAHRSPKIAADARAKFVLQMQH